MPEPIIIVSGLPRSGTSMMMAMLAAGGIPILTDGVRRADEHNPRGYFEFEAVKQTAGDASWLPLAPGKAVKMVYRLLYDLPSQYRYRVVFMRRDLQEVLASQDSMLDSAGTPRGQLGNDELRASFENELRRIRKWLDEQPNFDVFEVDYHQALNDAGAIAVQLDEFLGLRLDIHAMQAVPDQALYRHRA